MRASLRLPQQQALRIVSASRALSSRLHVSCSSPPSGFMLFLLSPAKTLDEKPLAEAVPSTQPQFAADAVKLSAALAALPGPKLRELLDVNASIAATNAKRYAGFASAVEKPALYSFNGPAYKALNASPKLSVSQRDWVNARLRILCGLYGVLRPLDALRPYRLEMGTKMAGVGGAKDLYSLWGDRIALSLAADIAALPAGERCVVNVASQEYWKAVEPHAAKLGAPVYTMVFATAATVYAKAARGAIVRFAAEIGATRPEQLQAFTGADGSWKYDASASSEFVYTFRKGAVAKSTAPPAKRARK